MYTKYQITTRNSSALTCVDNDNAQHMSSSQ